MISKYPKNGSQEEKNAWRESIFSQVRYKEYPWPKSFRKTATWTKSNKGFDFKIVAMQFRKSTIAFGFLDSSGEEESFFEGKNPDYYLEGHAFCEKAFALENSELMRDLFGDKLFEKIVDSLPY